MLGIRSDECIFVGGQPYDITESREAGFRFIGAAWGSGYYEILSLYHPDSIIHEPRDRMDFLDSIQK